MKESSGLRKAPPVTTRSTPGLSTRVVITGRELVMTVRFLRVVRFFATSRAVEPVPRKMASPLWTSSAAFFPIRRFLSDCM
ncbi:MAG: hypothetical protein ABR929_11475 [Roseiarcus sp.]